MPEFRSTIASGQNRGANYVLDHPAVTTVENWSNSNRLLLNADKCKELQIDFKSTKQNFDPLTVYGKKLPAVQNAKILGLTISSNLKWTNHINEVIKKANKRLYFIILLKRAKVSPKDIVNFYYIHIHRLYLKHGKPSVILHNKYSLNYSKLKNIWIHIVYIYI